MPLTNNIKRNIEKQNKKVASINLSNVVKDATSFPQAPFWYYNAAKSIIMKDGIFVI